MARAKSQSVRTTVYRLTGAEDLSSCVRQKYLEMGFESQPVEVAGVPAQLVSGSIITSQVRWSQDLLTLSGVDVELGNETAAAVLMLPIGEVIYAVTYGMGHHLLHYEHVDPAFGLRLAARVLDPDDLRTVTRHTLDTRARIDRSSIPGGADARAFGLSDLGNVASRVIGRANLVIGDAARTVSVRGADSLNMPLGRTPAKLLDDLRRIESILDQPVPDPELELLTRFTALRPTDPRRSMLYERLSTALQGTTEEERLGTGWPWEQADEFGLVAAIQVRGPGLPLRQVDALTIDLIKSLITEAAPADPVKWLARTKTLLLADTDDDEIASPEIAALKWIAYETRVGNTLYFFHDGRWFAVDDDYSRTVRAEANRILGTAASITLPAWTDQPEEKDYNAFVAKQDPRYLLMDRKKIHTKMHRYGIEACDLLGPADEFIHVKRLRGSDDASHLFAQALVATDALLLDPEARQKFADRVHQQSGGGRSAPEIPKTVVLAIAGRGHLDANSLFTFSQVTLVRLEQQLYLRGIAVRVIAIPE